MREQTNLQVWGGIECTVNRVGDRFHDQFAKCGHLDRPEDLDRIAQLGIRTLRYPVLWERTAPDRPDDQDWRFSDERLGRLRELKIEPIVGLVHHGSGPRYTNLLDEGFAPGLADHARAVAERYPWVNAYTPVNEPLTTARFSALYGHWYPHATDERRFAQALLNQVRATILSMEAIRTVNPAARLVQTDDLGRTHATHPLRYQAEFDNERRWLTWDLLCGRVDRHHRMWSHFLDQGIGERELEWFLEKACPPAVVGVNYYLTSERFLDHRQDRYPPHTYGGNAVDRYADVEAVRVLAGGIDGPASLLRDAWERYRLPVAVTECHLGCTREEQVRWLGYVWNEAEEARASGVDVRAVTVWSMFGAHDWCSLLTCDANRYEPGVFDVRAPEPRPTALAHAVASVARGKPLFVEGEGWWERPMRLLYPPALEERVSPVPAPKRGAVPAAPLMILGDDHGLTRLFSESCERRGIDPILVRHDEMDATSLLSVRRTLDLYRPWAVIDLSKRGGGALAEACAEISACLLLLSGEEAFDGRKLEPYVESDPSGPSATAARETEATRILPGTFIVRVGALFGKPSPNDTFFVTLRALRQGVSVPVAQDAVVSPTFAPHLVENVLDLLIDGFEGPLHLVSETSISPADFARRIAVAVGLGEDSVTGVLQRWLRPKAPLPATVGLRSERLWVMPSLEDALQHALALPLPEPIRARRPYVS